MKKLKSSNECKTGIIDVVMIVFIILKLTGLITWSWWLVLIPLWVEIVIAIVLVLCDNE